MPLRFNHLGDCHNVALALHRLSGLPLCILYGERDNACETEYVLIHVGLIYQDCFFDELGNQSIPRDLLQEFVEANEPYSFTDIYHFETDCGEFHKILSQTYAQVHPERVDKFMQWVLENKEKYPFLK